MRGRGLFVYPYLWYDVHMSKKENKADAPRVLIVEDEHLLCDLMVRKIKGVGCEVEGAVDGETALEAVEKNPPDLILLDLLLPGIDGFEVLRRLKKDDRFKHIPVIVVSNLGDTVNIQKAMSEGAAEYLVKAEVNPATIAERVLHYVKRGE